LLLRASRGGGEEAEAAFRRAIDVARVPNTHWLELRAAGTVDTFVISWLLTGSAKLAGGIASVEVVTKMVLYYLHERAGSRSSWGRSGHRDPVVSRTPAAARKAASEASSTAGL
jgi:uncharacterized membrane protein